MHRASKRQHDHRDSYLGPLAELELLADCSRAQLSNAASLLTQLTLPAGETLLRENTIGREFLIVVDGMLEITRRSSDGTQLLGVVGAGDVVGEMSLLDRTPRTATVKTITPATVFAGSAREFFALLNAVPSAGERIAAIARERQELNRAA
jgi:CRP-like cAMP-binding protein